MPPSTAETPVLSLRVPLIVAAAFFMETLDGSIIVTALPAIARGFHDTTLALGAGISAYLVAVAVFVPAAGWLSERVGARNLFASAIGVFTLASLLCGLSASFWPFIGARVLQGAAAAFMSPVGRLVVLRETPKQRLIESLGLIVWPALIGPVIGPPLGGLITTYASWHWIFFLNLPIGALGLWLVLRYIPNHPPGPRRRFDWVGFGSTALALVAAIQGCLFLAEGAAQRTSGLASLAAGAVLGVLAWRHALRHPSPLLDLQATREPTFVLSTISAGLLGRISIQATPFLLPLMFQLGFGQSPLRAGLMVLAYMGGNLMMKSATTWMLRRFGYRNILVWNGLLGAAAVAACGQVGVAWPWAATCILLVLAGMTRSMQFTALNTIAFTEIPTEARTGATTLAAIATQVSAAAAIAFATLVLASAQSWRGGSALALVDFRFAFVACAMLLAASALYLLRLPRGAGSAATA